MTLYIDAELDYGEGALVTDPHKVDFILKTYNVHENRKKKPVMFHAGRYVVLYEFSIPENSERIIFFDSIISIEKNVNRFLDSFPPDLIRGFKITQDKIIAKGAEYLESVELQISNSSI